jgi:hypothetical protein
MTDFSATPEGRRFSARAWRRTPDESGSLERVPLPLSRAWRECALGRRLDVWGPAWENPQVRHTHGAAGGGSSATVAAAWVIVVAVAQLAGLGGVPIVVSVVAFWPAVLFGFVRGYRLMVRGMHQAAEVVATSNKVSVPMRWPSEYELWIRESRHSRFREAGQGQAGPDEIASYKRARAARRTVGWSLVGVGLGAIVLAIVR